MRISAKKTMSLLATALSFAVLIFFVLITWVSAAAPTYVPLVGIPGVTDVKSPSLGDYINAIYKFTISVGGLIGVIKISMAGVKYSMSDVITDKSEARKDIFGVLLGLVILFIPFIVLSTINKDLINLDVLKTAKDMKIELKPSGASGQDSSQMTAQEFVAKLPNPPFDSRGVCQDESNSYTVIDPDGVPYTSTTCGTSCRSVCTQNGGTLTPMPGSSCKGVCMKGN